MLRGAPHSHVTSRALRFTRAQSDYSAIFFRIDDSMLASWPLYDKPGLISQNAVCGGTVRVADNTPKA